MPNVKYIIEAIGHKTDVILPVEDYKELIEMIIESSTLAAFYPAAKWLSLSEGAVRFIEFLVKSNKREWNNDFFLRDNEIANICNVSKKTVQRERNELKEYMKGGGKAIVDIKSEYAAKGNQIGTTYNLRILQSISKALRGLLESNKITVESLHLYTKEADTMELSKSSHQNSIFVEIFNFVNLDLEALPNKPTILETVHK